MPHRQIPCVAPRAAALAAACLLLPLYVHGGNYKWTHLGPEGGEFIRALAIEPAAMQTLYAGIWGGGGWAYSSPPIMQITMSKSSYVNGETVTATEFRLVNGGSAIACELRVWMEIQGISPIGILNLGADGTFVLTAGFDQDFGPLPILTVVPGLPRGIYEFSSRMVDPVTGSLLSEDLNPFPIQ